jgi:hypothetical protein
MDPMPVTGPSIWWFIAILILAWMTRSGRDDQPF